jgi:DNA (cytosine-5)-methyltransferase 1
MILLDLFSGAGGAAMGYNLAGFEVIGVDVTPQPHFPFQFMKGDALDVLVRCDLRGIDVIHASPPCQHYSKMSNCRPGLSEDYPDLIGPVRELLQASGKPYIIENVEGSPLRNPTMLCGWAFGRDIYRHRFFESNVPLQAPRHRRHDTRASRAGHWEPGTFISISGHCGPVALARKEMEMDWTTIDELVEAVPPYYTEYLGHQVMKAL